MSVFENKPDYYPPYSPRGDSDTENETDCTREHLEAALCLSASAFFTSVGGSCAEYLPAQPGLSIDGASINLPLLEGTDQYDSVLAACTPCAHGRGEETVVDAAVRSTMHVPASRVHFANPRWLDGLQRLADDVAVSLGMRGGSMTPHAYDLLVYRAGDHFAEMHTDSEKRPGMVATLVIQLPSRCVGAALVVRHGDVEVRHDFGRADKTAEYECHYAAHYADVHHCVEAVEEGVRVAMVYNLVWAPTKADAACPELLKATDTIKAVVEALKTWDRGSKPLAVTLAHAYTAQSMRQLSFLKGTDAAALQILEEADEMLKRETGDGISMVLATMSRSAAATDSHHFEAYLPGKVRVDPHLGSNLPVPVAAFYRPGEFQPSRDFAYYIDKALFWHNKFTEVTPTGNEGSLKATRYKQTVLIIWPERLLPEILTAGNADLLPLLKGLGEDDRASKSGHQITDDVREQLVRHLATNATYDQADRCLLTVAHRLNHPVVSAVLRGPHGDSWDIVKTLCGILLSTGIMQEVASSGADWQAILEAADKACAGACGGTTVACESPTFPEQWEPSAGHEVAWSRKVTLVRFCVLALKANRDLGYHCYALDSTLDSIVGASLMSEYLAHQLLKWATHGLREDLSVSGPGAGRIITLLLRYSWDTVAPVLEVMGVSCRMDCAMMIVSRDFALLDMLKAAIRDGWLRKAYWFDLLEAAAQADREDFFLYVLAEVGAEIRPLDCDRKKSLGKKYQALVNAHNL